jgi:hypothetical protein
LVNFGCDVGLFVVDSDLRRERERREFGPTKRLFLGGLKSFFFLLQFGTNGWVGGDKFEDIITLLF